jgi:hypothetical protein
VRIAVVFVALAALGCSNRAATGPTQGVTALAGPVVAEAGATILSHLADGTILDDQTADATGRAEVQTAPGAYVSAIFPALIDPLPTSIAIVTTPATADGSELVIHGPPHAVVPVVIAGLTVKGPALAAATQYSIDLGCNTQTSSTLPAIVDVIGPCEGTDTNLDVLVRAYDASGNLLGYGAGRVPIGTDQAGNSIAELDVDAWQTTGTMVPVTQTGTTATIALELVSDTLPFPTPAIANGQALVWSGLVVDSSVATATMGGQAATQFAPGTPAAIAIGAGDFLGAVQAPALAANATLTATWPAVALTGPDALDLHLTWSTSTATLTWDAVVSPDTAEVVFPQLDSTTQQVIALPGDLTMVSGQLVAIDSSELTGFADVQAAGIFANAAIVPTPATGEIRTSSAAYAP